MAYTSTAILLSAEQRSVLEKNMAAATSEQRLAFRSRVILLAADGIGTNAIAAQLQTTPATVSKWRVRFARAGLAGLADDFDAIDLFGLAHEIPDNIFLDAIENRGGHLEAERLGGERAFGEAP